MNCRAAVCFVCLVMCAWGAVAQEKSLQGGQGGQGGPAAAALDAMKPAEKQEPAKAPNSNATYQALRGRTATGATVAVKNFTLKRDAGVFTFSDGTFFLFSDVNGMTTGAVFLGEGSLHVEPPSAMERKQLKIVMKAEVLDQRFTTAVFEFTDKTAEEIKKGGGQGAGAKAGSAADALTEAHALFRKNLKYDLEARLLEDVGRNDGGFFLADMKGPMLSKRLIFVVDPHGATGVEPEEVALMTSADGGYDVALGFHSEAQRKLAMAADNTAFRIPRQSIDLTIDKSGRMDGTAVSAVTARVTGVQVLPLQMFPMLRVSGVWGPGGEALDFIQENKDRDADFAVLLKKPLAAGETIEITTKYAGKGALTDEGNGNYFLVAREDWFPNMRGQLGNYGQYRMTFHTAKTLEVVATGNKISQQDDGGNRTSIWQTTVPIAVAGFNMGIFKSDQGDKSGKTQVVSYANTLLASVYESVKDGSEAMGTMSTTKMLQRATSEGDAAVKIYTEFFGPLEYDHVSLTQQTACDFGQSWPMLVYLPICYFFDSTVQHQMGLLDSDPTYWNVVTAHEVAHQWWGQTVGFSSYRDQWMSEGFADYSASLFLLQTRKDPKEYRDFWTLERKRLLEKNKNGVRPVDIGPVVMGTRVNTSHAGDDVYQSLIYPKGAYILHMLSALFWTPQYKDEPFKKAMHDFVNTYRDRAATTEDFKAVMERNMPQWLDLDQNHRLDWFFNEYVYGTEVPKYAITAEFTKNGDVTSAHMKLTQSGVSDDFKMLVPLYLELADKRVVMIGRATIKGSGTVEQTLNLGKLPSNPVKMSVNYYNDVLSD